MLLTATIGFLIFLCQNQIEFLYGLMSGLYFYCAWLSFIQSFQWVVGESPMLFPNEVAESLCMRKGYETPIHWGLLTGFITGYMTQYGLLILSIFSFLKLWSRFGEKQ